MTYLYGDSLPSGLESNFIELLRRALDFSVHAVQADLRLGDARARRAERELRCQGDLGELEQLGRRVLDALADAQRQGDTTPVGRCANAIGRGAADAARAEREAVNASLAADLALIDAECARERASCVSALEALVLRHDLPQASTTIELEFDGARYHARLRGATPYGVEIRVDLEIPSSSPFAHDVRVERLIDGLEVHAPESGGVFRKQVRLTPHKLGKHHVVHAVVGPKEMRVKLRENHEKHAPGFDVIVRADEPRLEITRCGKDGELPINEATDAERARFVELDAKLRAHAAELSAAGRKALVDARFDGKPLADCDRPGLLAERLVAAMTPVVQEIARHALTSTELVLKRKLADDRREEIFVSKSELRKKLDALPEAQRALFADLGLDDSAPRAPLAVGSRPPPAPPRDAAEVVAKPFPRLPTAELTDGDVLELEIRDERPATPVPDR